MSEEETTRERVTKHYIKDLLFAATSDFTVEDYDEIENGLLVYLELGDVVRVTVAKEALHARGD